MAGKGAVLLGGAALAAGGTGLAFLLSRRKAAAAPAPTQPLPLAPPPSSEPPVAGAQLMLDASGAGPFWVQEKDITLALTEGWQVIDRLLSPIVQSEPVFTILPAPEPPPIPVPPPPEGGGSGVAAFSQVSLRLLTTAGLVLTPAPGATATIGTKALLELRVAVRNLLPEAMVGQVSGRFATRGVWEVLLRIRAVRADGSAAAINAMGSDWAVVQLASGQENAYLIRLVLDAAGLGAATLLASADFVRNAFSFGTVTSSQIIAPIVAERAIGFSSASGFFFVAG